MHVAAVYDGTTISMFINGQPESTKTANFQIAANNLPLSLGSQDDGYRHFKGGLATCEFTIVPSTQTKS